ncbi:MAG: sodium-dependent transporter [Lachnospiraceae bacterium]|nr:sodium-dependent transporter [Lachnospiraceae bacterium]
MEEKRSKFSGRLGFVLAAAGSAVGLGNIWRFPYLAAKYGGGMFVLVYIVLALTFGYTMIISETALGRYTGKAPVGAFRKVGANKIVMQGGWLHALIPLLIVPYYSVIGGWVLKYLVEYIKGNEAGLATDNLKEGEVDFFSNFIGSGREQMIWFLLFAAMVIIVVMGGVKNGIERMSRICMPMLVVLSIVVVVYSVTRTRTVDGVTYSAFDGVKYFLIPNLDDFSLMTIVAALGQMFYSLSIAMGILITFGSYMKKEDDIEASTKQVEIFDTLIAIIAGLMIIPAVFAYNGGANIKETAGPSLMFIALPNVFYSMNFGRIIGIVFFLLVLFAAVTSAVSLAECVVATFEDELHWNRFRSSAVTFGLIVMLGTLSALGFNDLGNVKPLNMQFLDFFDFITNSVMMPIASILTCVLIIRSVGLDKIEAEIEATSKFKRKKLFRFVIRYVAIAFLLIILVSSILNAVGVIKI